MEIETGLAIHYIFCKVTCWKNTRKFRLRIITFCNSPIRSRNKRMNQRMPHGTSTIEQLKYRIEYKKQTTPDVCTTFRHYSNWVNVWFWPWITVNFLQIWYVLLGYQTAIPYHCCTWQQFSMTSLSGFFKENVRYPVRTCRDPILMFSDFRDPIFNSRDPNRVPKTLNKNLSLYKIDFEVLPPLRCSRAMDRKYCQHFWWQLHPESCSKS